MYLFLSIVWHHLTSKKSWLALLIRNCLLPFTIQCNFMTCTVCREFCLEKDQGIVRKGSWMYIVGLVKITKVGIIFKIECLRECKIALILLCCPLWLCSKILKPQSTVEPCSYLTDCVFIVHCVIFIFNLIFFQFVFSLAWFYGCTVYCKPPYMIVSFRSCTFMWQHAQM